MSKSDERMNDQQIYNDRRIYKDSDSVPYMSRIVAKQPTQLPTHKRIFGA